MFRGLGMAMAMLKVLDVAPYRIRLPEYLPLISVRHTIHRGAKRRKTGKKYPHCSARQEARYRRQIAAGQLRMAGVENV